MLRTLYMEPTKCLCGGHETASHGDSLRPVGPRSSLWTSQLLHRTRCPRPAETWSEENALLWQGAQQWRSQGILCALRRRARWTRGTQSGDFGYLPTWELLQTSSPALVSCKYPHVNCFSRHPGQLHLNHRRGGPLLGTEQRDATLCLPLPIGSSS